VAWLSPDEKSALKRFAADAGSSLADLVRALASGLEHGVITTEELLRQVRKGQEVMEKIPTLFDRGDDFKVVDSVRAGCEWVVAGDGVPTEKLDGTNIRLTVRMGTVVRVEKRRNPTRVQKQRGIKDGWYVDAFEADRADRWIFEAVRGTDTREWPDGEHPCEALGPKIQGNPLHLPSHVCVPFNLEVPRLEDAPRDFTGLRDYLARLESRYAGEALAEGIVFHHPDGRRAKIKRKDFAGLS